METLSIRDLKNPNKNNGRRINHGKGFKKEDSI